MAGSLESHLPKIARVAAIVAFAAAALMIVSALSGPIAGLPFALIPLFAGIGILRRRVWSAYGFVLYLLTQIVLLALLLYRHVTPELAELGILGGAFMVVLIPLFLFAGRSLAATQSQRGSALPWIIVSAVTCLPFLFVQAFMIPTGSMEVFLYPVDPKQTFVKRVIGIAGDRIRISGKVVYRDGVALNEPYATHKTDYVDQYRDNFPSDPNIRLEETGQDMLRKHVVNGEVVVPAGKYFVLGDNRDNSLDSRYWGFLDKSDVIGKPLLIYGSEDQSAQGGPHRVRWERLFKLL